MLKRVLASLLAIGALATDPGGAQPLPPRTFRFLSEWRVPARSVRAFADELDKTVRPILKKSMEEGTVLDYGIYTTVVEEEEGSTNGYWFGIPSQAALEKVLDALGKVPPSAIADSAIKHHDYLLRRELHATRPASGTNGYLYFNSTLIQPGKTGDWRAWWDHYQKPLYDKFLADGLITSYEIDSGEMHTMDPNMAYLIWVSPTGEALDKMNDVWIGRGASQTAEEKRTMATGLANVVVAGSHRDYFARALTYVTR